MADAQTFLSDTQNFYALRNQKTGELETQLYSSEIGAKRAQGRLNGRPCGDGCGCKLDLVKVTVTVGDTVRIGTGPAPVQAELPGTEATPAAAPVEG